jgi:hypothetical protein
MHGDEERELREAVEAFEAACKALVEAIQHDRDHVDARFAEAEARLRAARDALAAARRRKHEARPHHRAGAGLPASKGFDEEGQ